MGQFIHKRGDTLRLLVAVKTATGGAMNLTGAKVWFTVKPTYATFDTEAVVVANSDDGSGDVVITDAENGLVTCRMQPISTRSFPDGDVTLLYDVQVKDAAGDVSTVDEGTITVKPDLSRAIS